MSFYTRILSIDPGAKRFGWAIVDFDINENMVYEPSYVSSGVLGIERGLEETYVVFKNRLISFFIPEFEKLLKEYQPDLVVFEFLPIANVKGNIAQRVLVFAVATVAQTICIQSEIPFKEIAATTIKKCICGSMRATKVQIRNAVLKTFPQLEPRKKEIIADESDAIAVALAWMSEGNPWNKKNIES